MLILVYISGAIQAEFGVGTRLIGLLVSALFFGMIPGAIAWGYASDRIGRKRCCVASLGAYGALTAVAVVSTSYWMLWGLRVAAGFALAGVLVTVFPYFEEMMPVRHRGRATVYLAAGWPIGTLCAVGITLAISPTSWRWVLLASAAAGLWALVIWRWVPESPYWLAQQNRNDEAREVLHQLGAERLHPATRLTVADIKAGSLRQLFTGRIGMITVLQVIVNFTFAWGYWGLQTWLPTLLQNKGLSVPDSLGFIAISAVFMIPGYISASWLTGRYGRKWVFIGYVAAAALGGFYFVGATTMTELYVGIFVLSFFSLGAWGVWDTWMGEFYPTPLRTSGYSWGIMSQRAANTLHPPL